MRFKTFLNLGFLCLLYEIHAIHNNKRQGTSLVWPLPAPDVPPTWNIVRSGRYSIINCGRQESDTVTTLLNSLHRALQFAIHDAIKSQHTPSAAFKTFFIYASTATYVTSLLTNISTGTSLYEPDASGLGVNQPSSGSPIFFCITGPGQGISSDPAIGDYDNFCASNPGVVMDYPGGSPYIVICPSFYTIGLPALPPLSNCIIVDHRINRFLGNGAKISHFQIWVLLEEIAHYYINAGKGNTVDVYDINKCARLSARASISNANNYLYYVASKDDITSIDRIWQRYTN